MGRERVLVPHLQVALGGKRLAAHGALEGPVARVRPHVDLQRGAGAEVLGAHAAHVPACRLPVGRGGRGGRGRQRGRRAGRGGRKTCARIRWLVG